ncbi:MAG: 4-hydroxythreonine-4-phosphate dehydrogenase PdxA [Thermodesulfobacteriota bacterium]
MVDGCEEYVRPKIAITMGDPAGVGPELVLRAVADSQVLAIAEPLIYGDFGVLELVARRLGLAMPPSHMVIGVTSIDASDLMPGRAHRVAGEAMIACVKRAVTDALAGEAAAIVTAPINKETASLSGFPFPGHTEYIAHLCGDIDPVMMLCGPGAEDLKVALVTTHVSMRELPALITEECVLRTIRITADSLKKLFAIEKPLIAVAGLNPHAGEGGIFGAEEAEVIAPAIKRARAENIDVRGPEPPDTVFYRAVRKKEFNAVVCMYHDQGLGPLKLLHFDDGINVTLGLPVIRTSPDHGTAYDIAWKGVASPLSLISAIEMAAMMAGNREKFLLEKKSK